MKTIALALLIVQALLAQSPKLKFEVASIRPVTPGANGAAVTAGVRIDGAQFRASMMPLRSLVASAFRMRLYQIEAPEWMSTQWYEIAATLPESRTKTEEVREMLEALLAERFHMRTHRETKDFPIYVLTVAKGGIQAKEDPLDPIGRSTEVVGTGSETRSVTRMQRGATLAIGDNKIEARKFTMEALANALTPMMDRPVLNQTGLAADAGYDVTLELTQEDFLATRVRSAIAAGFTPPAQAMKLLEASGDSLRTALAKMGLELEPKKAPLEVLVIDSADKAPSEN